MKRRRSASGTCSNFHLQGGCKPPLQNLSVYMFIEAMADAAVADGMPRKQAYKFAAQSVRGAAKMVLETGEHPGVLKDAVCSPGGTTIAAVAELEKSGLRSSVIEAQRACVQKSRDMSKE